MKNMRRAIFLVVLLLAGCAMFSSWQKIPVTGECAECHHVPINSDWQILYKPVDLTDETGQFAWQQPSSMEPASVPVKQQEVSRQECFRCHRTPDKKHKQYKGHYQHR